jgi:cysteine synthase A
VTQGSLSGAPILGAAVYAAVDLARELGPGKRIAVIIPDSAERYLSRKIFKGGV